MPVGVPQYPVNLVLDGRRCLVVGGGPVALRKVDGLLACGAVVTVVAPRVVDGLRGYDGVTIEQRPYRRGDVAGYHLVITATDEPEVNRAVYLDADAAGIWVNSADDPASCTFTLPSVVRRGPLMVTVSTGGHSPALARWLKEHVAAEMGPEYAVLLEVLSQERAAQQAAGRSTEELNWQKALDSDMLDLIRAGQVEEARERLQACLSSS